MGSKLLHLLAVSVFLLITLVPLRASGLSDTSELFAVIDLLRGNVRGGLTLPDQGIIPLVSDIATTEGINPMLFRALVECESGLDHKAKSHRGAIGLCQLMPGTAKELGVNPYNIKDNLSGGARYFKRLLVQFEDVRTALWAYNFGPTAVAAGRPIPFETRVFADRVIARFFELNIGK